MKNKSCKWSGQAKGKPAIRSAGNQTTGNCNKLLLVAERGRTDKANGRLNKQNPVGSQKMNPINKRDEQAKNAGRYRIELMYCTGAMFDVANTADSLINKGQTDLGKKMKNIWLNLHSVKMEIIKLK